MKRWRRRDDGKIEVIWSLERIFELGNPGGMKTSHHVFLSTNAKDAVDVCAAAFVHPFEGKDFTSILLPAQENL